MFYVIAFHTLQGCREYGVCLAVLSYLCCDETHGTHIGQAKRAHDVCQAIATKLLTEIHGHLAGE